MIEFFKNELNCSNVPKQVIDFYNKYDGKRLTINEIFSKEEIKQEINGYFKEFLNSGIKNNEDDPEIYTIEDILNMDKELNKN